MRYRMDMRRHQMLALGGSPAVLATFILARERRPMTRRALMAEVAEDGEARTITAEAFSAGLAWARELGYVVFDRSTGWRATRKARVVAVP